MILLYCQKLELVMPSWGCFFLCSFFLEQEDKLVRDLCPQPVFFFFFFLWTPVESSPSAVLKPRHPYRMEVPNLVRHLVFCLVLILIYFLLIVQGKNPGQAVSESVCNNGSGPCWLNWHVRVFSLLLQLQDRYYFFSFFVRTGTWFLQRKETLL